MKAVNNNTFIIEKYDLKTFKNIAKSDLFINHFKDKVWDTNVSKHLDFIKPKKGAIKFDYSYGFDFFNYDNLKADIKKRTESFEKINWKPRGSLQYYSAKELHLWEIWLEQVEFIDSIFKKYGL